METLEQRLARIGFSSDAGTEIRERIGDDYMPSFLALVVREVANLNPTSSIPFGNMKDQDLQKIIDEMGVDMSDAFADDPEKWLGETTAVALLV